MFYLNSAYPNDPPVKAMICRGGECVFLFQNDRVQVCLTANDIFLLKEEIDTERSYKEFVWIYLLKLSAKMEPDFKLVIDDEAYLEEITERFAERIRPIHLQEVEEELRQRMFDEAFKQVNYRSYLKRITGQNTVKDNADGQRD